MCVYMISFSYHENARKIPNIIFGETFHSSWQDDLSMLWYQLFCNDMDDISTIGEESLYNLNCKALYFHWFHLTFIHLYSNSDNLNSPPTRSKFPFLALIKIALKFSPDNSNSASCYPTLTPSY